MSDKMRDEFEIAFAKKTAGLPTDEQTKEFDEIGGFESVLLETMIEERIGDTYRTNIFASAWWAWQASRSAVVIDIPKDGEPFVVGGVTSFSLYNQGRNAAISEFKCSIEAAGLKVKS